jgi:hypothetical protein
METLNKDILYYIAMKLKLKDLFNLSLTCKRMYFDNYFWRNKIKCDFPRRSNFKSLEYKELYLKKPKQLYNIINSKSRIITLREEDFPNVIKYIGKSIFLPPDEMINNASKELENLSILRGDVIKLEWLDHYVDAFKLFWDGEKLVLTNFDINDYGNIPKIFTFPEFPIDHFTESMESSFHNSFENTILIWLSDLSICEAIKNFNEETQKSRINDLYNCYVLAHDLDYHLSTEDFSEFLKEKSYISKFINGEYIIGDNFWETM